MKNFHPVTILIFFAAMTIPLMMPGSSVFTVISLIGAVIMLILERNRRGVWHELAGYLLIFAVMSVLNPLFVHRGSTPLFFLNGKAVTLEALVYGINSSLRLVTAVIWFRSFSIVMTSERLFCLIGKLSPKISAIIAMAVRFVPDMLEQRRKISAYSRVSGQGGDDSITGRLKNSMTIFSALVTWSIESGVQTADSMKARGFELGGRTSYSRFRFSAEDIALMLLGAFSCAAAFLLNVRMNVNFYPELSFSHEPFVLAAASVMTAASYLFPAVFGKVISCRRNRAGRCRADENS